MFLELFSNSVLCVPAALRENIMSFIKIYIFANCRKTFHKSLEWK
jgi:hypothetical protein